MNWTKVAVAGVVGGIVMWLFDFLMHGIVLGQTYTEYPVFTQEAANPAMFLVISFCIALTAAVIYAKTRDCWGGGAKGGILFGFLLGLFGSFPHFYNVLVLEGWPYFLCWAWAGISTLGMTIVGVVIALVYK